MMVGSEMVVLMAVSISEDGRLGVVDPFRRG